MAGRAAKLNLDRALRQRAASGLNPVAFFR